MTDQTEKYVSSVGEAIEAHRKFARDAIEQASARAADRIKRGRYTERDAADLTTSIENVRTSLAVLGQHLDGLTSVSSEAGLQAWYYVGTLMEAMYAMGGQIEISESQEKAGRSYHQRAAAGQGRNKEWKARGLSAAKEYINNHPSYTYREIAEYIVSKSIRGAPDRRQIETVVSEWVRAGKLSKSTNRIRLAG
jgi:hypothetical protein